MSNSAARVIRIKIPGKDFGSQAPHASGNLLMEGVPYTPTQEDREYERWGSLPNFIYKIVSKLLFIGERFRTKLKVLRIVESSPIPDSERFIILKNKEATHA